MSINLVITTNALKRPLTGIGNYTAHLLKELLDSPEMGDINGLSNQGLDSRQQLIDQLTLLETEQTLPDVKVSSPIGSNLASLARRLTEFSPTLTTGVRQFNHYRRSRMLRNRPDNLLHAPDFIPPDFSGKTILTIHDLSHIRFPETHPQHRVDWLKKTLPKALGRADRIICVSEFTKRELLDLGLVSDNAKLRVCLNGVDPGFKPRAETEISPTLAKWKLRHRAYIVSVATLEPRKNLSALVDAYAALPEEIAAGFPLVLIGCQGWKNQEVMEKITRLPPPYRILTTGYVDTVTLQHLLCGASLFAYCSLYEGFGLPVIEAMASDTPVIISNAEALCEVAGNAARPIDTSDPYAFSQTIIKVLENRLLSGSLREQGLQRATEFSWGKCAQGTIAVYKELL